MVSIVPSMGEELSVLDFQSRVDTMHSHAWFKGFYYLGSDEHFHHFIEKWDFRLDPKYEVARDVLEVAGVFQAGLKEARFSSFESASNQVLFTIGERLFYLCE